MALRHADGHSGHTSSRLSSSHPNSSRKQYEVDAMQYTVLSKATNEWDRKVGQGGFGEVFAGELENHEFKKIAVKRMFGAVGTGPLGKAAFEREISVAETVRHACVQRVIGKSRDGPVRCLVYPLATSSLDDRLHRRGSAPALKFALRVRIAMELASGLEALHDAHIAHADVKCANVLLDAQMHAALTDMGSSYQLAHAPPPPLVDQLAVHIRELEGEDSLPELPENPCGEGEAAAAAHERGTEGYRAPELKVGARPTLQADIYSLGVVLLELLTGEPPVKLNVSLVHSVNKRRQEGEQTEAMSDASAEWPVELAVQFMDVANSCVRGGASTRPPARDLLQRLRELVTEHHILEEVNKEAALHKQVADVLGLLHGRDARSRRTTGRPVSGASRPGSAETMTQEEKAALLAQYTSKNIPPHRAKTFNYPSARAAQQASAYKLRQQQSAANLRPMESSSKELINSMLAGSRPLFDRNAAMPLRPLVPPAMNPLTVSTASTEAIEEVETNAPAVPQLDLDVATVNPPSTLTMSRVRGKGLLTGRIMGDAKAARRAKKERERLAREREQRSHEEDFSMIWSSNRHQQQQCEHRLDLQEQQPLLEEGVRSVNQSQQPDTEPHLVRVRKHSHSYASNWSEERLSSAFVLRSTNPSYISPPRGNEARFINQRLNMHRSVEHFPEVPGLPIPPPALPYSTPKLERAPPVAAGNKRYSARPSRVIPSNLHRQSVPPPEIASFIRFQHANSP